MCIFCHTRGFNELAKPHYDRDCTDPQNHLSNVPYSKREKKSHAPILCTYCVEPLEECLCNNIFFLSRRYKQKKPLLPSQDINGNYVFETTHSNKFRNLDI
jgi:hypothetical protein